MNRLGQIKKMLESKPQDSFLLFALAKELENLDNLEEAVNTYTQLMELDPKYVGLYYHLGKLHQKMDREEKAKEIYKAGISCCKEVGDHHSLSEIQNALTNLELGLED